MTFYAHIVSADYVKYCIDRVVIVNRDESPTVIFCARVTCQLHKTLD